MYDAVKELLLDLFCAPCSPPDSPAGSHDSMQVFRASPNYLRYQTIVLTVSMLILGLALFIGGIVLIVNEPAIGIVVLVLAGILWFVIFVCSHFIIRLEYDMRYYIVTDRSLRIRKGVWTILEQTLTFVNIQNITVEQGPLERVFGISRLVVDTAGGGGVVANQQGGGSFHNYHRAVLNGLENAPEVRELMIDYLKKIPTTGGLGSPEEYRKTHRMGFSEKEIEALRDILVETKALRASFLPDA